MIRLLLVSRQTFAQQSNRSIPDNLQPLSEQQLEDCDTVDSGCHDELRVTPEEHHVLLTKAPWNFKAYRVEMVVRWAAPVRLPRKMPFAPRRATVAQQPTERAHRLVTPWASTW